MIEISGISYYAIEVWSFDMQTTKIGDCCDIKSLAP